MTPAQVELVQRSFAKIVPRSDAFAHSFYQRLFETAAGAEANFQADAKVQGDRMMSMLAKVVAGLHEPETIDDDVRALALKHVGHGVPDGEYVHIGASLIWALHRQLGDDFGPEVQEAWLAALELVFPTMIDATHEFDAPGDAGGAESVSKKAAAAH